MTDFLKDKIEHDNSKVIYTHRNILDVISSLKAKNKIEFTDDELRELVVRLKKTYLEWMQCKNIFIQKYDSIRNHLDICVKEIADALGIDISRERVEEIANTLAFDKQKKFLDQIRDSDKLISINENNTYDPDSLLHVNHIDDGGIGRYKKNLSQHETALIETVWGAGDAGGRV